jgi:hypothetical protein
MLNLFFEPTTQSDYHKYENNKQLSAKKKKKNKRLVKCLRIIVTDRSNFGNCDSQKYLLTLSRFRYHFDMNHLLTQQFLFVEPQEKLLEFVNKIKNNDEK